MGVQRACTTPETTATIAAPMVKARSIPVVYWKNSDRLRVGESTFSSASFTLGVSPICAVLVVVASDKPDPPTSAGYSVRLFVVSPYRTTFYYIIRYRPRI